MQVSIDYLIKNNIKGFNNIKKKLSKYNVIIPNSSDNIDTYKKIDIYKDNILDKYNYFIWDYKGVIYINSDNYRYQKMVDYDLYDNVLSVVVGKYYVVFDNTSVNGVDKIYYYDYKRNKLKIMKLKNKLSKDIYINGVMDNLIYVTDRNEKKEYTVNIGKEEIIEIDNEQSEYVLWNDGKKRILSKSDFFMDDLYFNSKNISNDKEIILDRGIKYILDGDSIYKIYSDMENDKVLLLTLENIDNWQVYNGELLILKEDTLYYYSDDTGLRKIIKTNELKYNGRNLYNIYSD